MTSHSLKNLVFRSLLRWKMIILIILRKCHFELGSGRVNNIVLFTARLESRNWQQRLPLAHSALMETVFVFSSIFFRRQPRKQRKRQPPMRPNIFHGHSVQEVSLLQTQEKRSLRQRSPRQWGRPIPDTVRGVRLLRKQRYGPGSSMPDYLNRGLSRNFPASLFLNVTKDSLPNRLHCKVENQMNCPGFSSFERMQFARS